MTHLPQHRDERRPQIEAMLDAIASLPEVLRETMELRLREQLSYEEIAQVMQIPVGTVRSRLHTAMKKLREILEAKANRSVNRESTNPRTTHHR